ncbi:MULTISPECIES: glycoside hydrolase family 36 protein [unclassified Halorubrum]|uniref:glycoside hydrolase family 36 protein n=1 Tax=unclassified Halorubrum TaxID=2642239 RepID=UPI000B9985AF|nr:MULTISPECIES: glycoside hydrolase family 36 protein [unclassified Halorubrum]OYR43391.1 alpha-galactosidase [Halorubrum sp. Hd13]OYR49078.1 alpha-galactosidase [Halorubrum sp. Ea8]OYR54140.1 alpha-galactosidase [Halorubrum sp. Ea1]
MKKRRADATAVTYDPTSHEVTIADDAGNLLVGALDAAAVDGDNERMQVADVSLSTEAGGVEAICTVENASNEPVRAGDITFRFETAFSADARVYRHGYQSWSSTGTLPVGERFPTESPDNAPMMNDLAASTDDRTSSYLTGLVEDDRYVTAGFLEHDRYCTRFEIDDDDSGVATLRAVCPLEGTRLAPGEQLALPPLWVDADRELREGLAALADCVGERMNARVPETSPTGWCSWYHYFTDVTEADVRENLAELREWGIPVDVVQIDDGYMEAFGDWRSIADGFEDMSDVADDISTTGYRPGLWLAPFYVEAGADLHADHPEWFITEPTDAAADGPGTPVDGGFRAGSSLYGLDTTHPEVVDWLRETVSTVVDDWGFTYLKLDFLFAAALPGERYDAEATRMEAYRRGIETIAEVAGDDVFLLGSGAPMAPSVGLFDAMRIGPDTDPTWETPGESGSQPALKNAVRNTLTRNYLHRRWWLNDPDCQLVRDTSDLTGAEREAFAALVATTGGVNVFSDRLAEIAPASRRLLERSIPPASDAEVAGLDAERFPSRVICDRPGDETTTVALFNWSDEPSTVRFDAYEHLERGSGADPIVWDGLSGTLVDGPVIERKLPPHGAAVFAAVPADTGDLLGDAATLTGGSDRTTTATLRDGTLEAAVDGESVTFVLNRE